MKNAEIREVQLAQLEMLREIDRICEKHGIKYSLFAGTALGAVRHKGFIPWDDDLDVIMQREEYGKFLAAAPAELDGKFFLQKEFSEHWPMFFSKLRKNNTAYIERYIPKDKETHQGIYVDIFPCDNLSDNKLLRKLQFFASKVVIAKSLYKRGYLTDSAKKKVFMQFCRFLPARPFAAIVKLCGRKNTKMVHSFFGASSKYEKSVYKREWISDTVNMQFEDGSFPVSKHYDALLTTLYGDYMTPLPEKDRGCKVHAEIADLEKSYEEYIDIQKNMKFDEYSRSIR